jgi:hypothetical protein
MATIDFDLRLSIRDLGWQRSLRASSGSTIENRTSKTGTAVAAPLNKSAGWGEM